MTDFLDDLERDLVAAARRLADADGRAATPRRWRVRSTARSALVAAVILVPCAGSAAAGTLLALRGSVIPAPEAVPPEQTPTAGTARVSPLRAADPARGVPPWTIRVARSETGLLCSTVGQVADGRFGLVGMDGRFRVLAPDVSDSCGLERHDAASLIGARVFAARHRADVRTVVSGVAGSALRAVEVDARGRVRRLAVGPGGTFVVALRGYPEDIAIRATLHFAGGRHEVHDFGRSPWVVPDPIGGPAWRTMGSMFGNDGRTCVQFSYARAQPGAPVSPSACGTLGDPLERRGAFFAVRRIAPGTGGTGRPVEPMGEGRWGRHAARTAVWGAAGDDVAAISVAAPHAAPRRLTITPGARTFLAVLPGTVDPRAVTVRVRLHDGRVRVAHGSTSLAGHPPPLQIGPHGHFVRITP